MWAASANRHCEIFARPVVCPQPDIVIDRTVTFYRHARILLVGVERTYACTHLCNYIPHRPPAIVRWTAAKWPPIAPSYDENNDGYEISRD